VCESEETEFQLRILYGQGGANSESLGSNEGRGVRDGADDLLRVEGSGGF